MHIRSIRLLTAIASTVVLSGCGSVVIDETSPDRVFNDKKVFALVEAAARGDVATVDALVGNGVDVNTRGRRNNTPLLLCYSAKHFEGYCALLRHKADPNVLNSDGDAVTLLAAADADSRWLREALKHGGDPNLVNIGHRVLRNQTPLFYAIGQDIVPPFSRETNVRLLIEAGAHLDHQDETKMTSFFLAVEARDFEAAIALLHAGADMHLKNDQGRDAVEWLREGIASGSIFAVDDDTKKWLMKLIAGMNAKGAKLGDGSSK